MKHEINIGIVGAGTMGSGLVQVAASSRYNVICFDTNSSSLNSLKTRIDGFLHRQVEKGIINEARRKEIVSNIHLSENYEAFRNCKLIIEAVVEDISVKQNLFCTLESIVSDDCILATNTSSLSITSIASVCKNPARVIGTHFFNPAPIMKLIEIIPGLLTSKEITFRTKEIINDWNKVTVLSKDTPGFIVNRIARPFYGEALRIFEEGIADHTTIDWAMKEFGKFKMGPFELMDLIGNDINYKVTENIFKETYFDSRYKPSIIQKRMVEANLLGRKTGKGFYDYSSDMKSEPLKDENLGEQIFNRILSMLINEAADAVNYKIASIEDIDIAMTTGVNYPKGLLRWADEVGIENVLSTIEELHKEYKEERYRPSILLKRMTERKEKFYK